MPSMHVTIAALMAAAGLARQPPRHILFTIFAVLIFVASIALAWHYAVDGLGGIVLAVIFWLAAGCLAKRWSAWCWLLTFKNIPPTVHALQGQIAP